MGRPPISDDKVEQIKQLREDGLSYRKIAEKVDLNVGTTHRYGVKITGVCGI